MALSPVNPFKPQKIAGNIGIFVIPQDETHNADSTEATADLSTIDEEEWVKHNIANCKSTQYTQDTEDDEEDSYDAINHVRVKKSNTTITARRYEFELERYSMLFEAVLHGVADPLSDATIAKMSAGEKLPIYQSNDPNIPVGVKLEMWDKGNHKMWTKFFYADMKADGELSIEGKILRPKLTMEVSASKFNQHISEQAFTGQTGSKDS